MNKSRQLIGKIENIQPSLDNSYQDITISGRHYQTLQSDSYCLRPGDTVAYEVTPEPWDGNGLPFVRVRGKQESLFC